MSLSLWYLECSSRQNFYMLEISIKTGKVKGRTSASNGYMEKGQADFIAMLIQI